MTVAATRVSLRSAVCHSSFVVSLAQQSCTVAAQISEEDVAGGGGEEGGGGGGGGEGTSVGLRPLLAVDQLMIGHWARSTRICISSPPQFVTLRPLWWTTVFGIHYFQGFFLGDLVSHFWMTTTRPSSGSVASSRQLTEATAACSLQQSCKNVPTVPTGWC